MMRPTSSQEGPGMTREELGQMTKAMRTEQFGDHLQEYMQEVSNPANRQEYLDYLDQLEAKGEMPKGTELLRVKPGLCVKTLIRFKGGQLQKLYINVCATERLGDFNMGDGQNVSLPFTLGPPRPEQDNKSKMCMTCEIAVSYKSVDMARGNPHFLKMLVDITTQNIEEHYLQGEEEVLKDYKICKNMQCKGENPYPMSVASNQLLPEKRRKKKKFDKKLKDSDVVTPSELKKMKKEAKDKLEADKQAELETSSEESEDEEAIRRREEEEIEQSKKIRVPKHKLIHSGEIDMGNFVGEETHQHAFQSLPKFLKLVVNLPTVKSAAEIDLDTSTDNVILEVPRKFYLDLPLPFDVVEDKAKAKFDKDTSVLTLTLPVIPKIYEKIEQPKSIEVVGGAGEISENESDSELPELREPVKQEEVKKADAETSSDTEAKVEETKKHVTRSSELTAERQSSLLCTTEQPKEIAEDDPRDFYQAAAAFDGARPGYVFKKGSRGVGYYRDEYQAPLSKEKAAAIAADGDDLLDKIAGRKKAEPAEEKKADSGPLVQEVETAPVWTPPVLETSSKTKEEDEQMDDSAPASPDSKQEGFAAPTEALLGKEQTSGQKDAEEEPKFVVSQNWQNAWFVFDFNYDDIIIDTAKVRLFDMVLVVQFCTKENDDLQVRHTVSRLICQNVDVEQCHFERLGLSEDAKLALVIRKTETSDGDWLGEVCEIESDDEAEDITPEGDDGTNVDARSNLGSIATTAMTAVLRANMEEKLDDKEAYALMGQSVLLSCAPLVHELF